jgi:hypothetical protein
VAFVRRHRVFLVLLALLAVVATMVALRLRDQQGRASAKPRSGRVQVGVIRPERRALEVSGLGPNDDVVLPGKELVRDGMPVQAIPAKTY